MLQWIVYQWFRGEGIAFTEKAKPETQMKKTSPLEEGEGKVKEKWGEAFTRNSMK